MLAGSRWGRPPLVVSLELFWLPLLGRRRPVVVKPTQHHSPEERFARRSGGSKNDGGSGTASVVGAPATACTGKAYPKIIRPKKDFHGGEVAAKTMAGAARPFVGGAPATGCSGKTYPKSFIAKKIVTKVCPWRGGPSCCYCM